MTPCVSQVTISSIHPLMFKRIQAPISAFVASLLLLAPALLPWAHVGCEHAHATSSHEDEQPAHSHDSCGHDGHSHHHRDSRQLGYTHSHEYDVAHGDCAACRLLSLAALAPTVVQSLASEPFCFSLAVPASEAPASDRVPIYLSRGPPKLA